MIFAFGAMFAPAADFYWTGSAGDGAWNNPANWTTSATGTNSATAYPGSADNARFLPARYPSGEVSVSIPSGTVVKNIFLRDDQAPGRIRLVGSGSSRVPLDLNGGTFTWNGSAAGCGVLLELENLSILEDRQIFSGGSTDGNGLTLRNSFLSSPSYELTFPGGNDSTLLVADSTIECKNIDYKQNTGTNCVISITNSSIRATGFFSANMPGLRLRVTDSTIETRGVFQIRGAGAVGEFLRSPLEVYDSFNIDGKGRSFSFVESNVGLRGGYSLNGGADGVLRIRDCTMYMKNTANTYGTIYLENGKLLNTNGYNGAGTEVPTRFVISGRNPQFMAKRFQGGTVHFDFIVPIGGYAAPPVGADGILTKFENVFLNTCANGSVNVLPESPAAREDGTGIYPLVYVYTGGTGKQFNCPASPPTGLPTPESSFFEASSSSLAMSAVNAQAESWWNPIPVGYQSNVAGLAVKIVGHDSRPPVVDGIRLWLAREGDVRFQVGMKTLGELPTGEMASSDTGALLVRAPGASQDVEIPLASPISNVGANVVATDGSLFTVPGEYRVGVRLSNEFGGTTTYWEPTSIAIDVSGPSTTELVLVGEGYDATATGRVTGTGSSATGSLSILHSTRRLANGFPADPVVTPGPDALAVGDEFSVGLRIEAGVPVYCCPVITASGVSVTGKVSSVVSRTVSSFDKQSIVAVNTNGLFRVVVDGVLASRGANATDVKIIWSTNDQEWTTNDVATISEDNASFSVSQSFPLAFNSGRVYYQLLAYNRSTDLSGKDVVWLTNSGDPALLSVKDYSTYYWQDVNGDWDGSWNDPAHWSNDENPGRLPVFPKSSDCSVDFGRCPAGTPVDVMLPESLNVRKISSKTSGQNLTLRGDWTVSVSAVFDLIQPSSTNTFSGIRWVSPGTKISGANGTAHRLVDGARVQVGYFNEKTSNNYYYIGDGCELVFDATPQSGAVNLLVEIDNGTFLLNGLVGQNNGAGSITYLFKGPRARMVYTGGELYINNSWTSIKYLFEVPVGGYESIPVSTESASLDFYRFSNPAGLLNSNFGSGRPDTGLIFEISPDSPAFLNGILYVNTDLLRWNEKGWAFDRTNPDAAQRYDLHDCTHFVIPKFSSAGTVLTSPAFPVDKQPVSLLFYGLDGNLYPDVAALKAAGTTAQGVVCKSTITGTLIKFR